MQGEPDPHPAAVLSTRVISSLTVGTRQSPKPANFSAFTCAIQEVAPTHKPSVFPVASHQVTVLFTSWRPPDMSFFSHIRLFCVSRTTPSTSTKRLPGGCCP